MAIKVAKNIVAIEVVAECPCGGNVKHFNTNQYRLNGFMLKFVCDKCNEEVRLPTKIVATTTWTWDI